jgi:hypothetical protein
VKTDEIPLFVQVLVGLLFFGVGLAIILLSGDVTPTEGELTVPGWVSKLAGGLFTAAGVMILNNGRLKWISTIVALYLISAFGLIFGWIALFGAAEGFGLNGRSGLNSFGVLVARIMFGGGALICAFLIVGTIVDQTIKLFKKSS